MHYFGVCAIIKDEDPFLDEWMAYYTLLGAEAFYLYDNGSAKPVAETLKKFERLHTSESLRIHRAPGVRLQMPAYGHCLAAYQNQCRWIAFMDIDEFVVPRRCDSIPAMLEEFEPYAGLAMSWKVFGSNGHAKRPAGLQLENFTRAMPEEYESNRLLKVIVKPDRQEYFPDPHMTVTKSEADIVVTENHVPIKGTMFSDPSWHTVQVNHYYFRAKHDFYAKLRKRRADINTLREVPPNFSVPKGSVEDLSALRFVPGVKRILDSLE